MAATSVRSEADRAGNGARALRRAIREGRHTGLTTGHAPGHVQANLVLLPREHAADFASFCERNRAACPVLAVSRAGSPSLPELGEDLDLRTDLPGYQVHRHGHETRTVPDIGAVWRDDLVAFAIGCWFSMEDALTTAHVRLRHVELGIQGPLFKTKLMTGRTGRFGGTPLVVSMRPFATESVATVTRITTGFPRVHGGPLHVGDASELGITDIAQPDFGEVLLPLPGEVPLFWACGLTAQVAIEAAGIDFFITHAPGKMLVADSLNASLAGTAT